LQIGKRIGGTHRGHIGKGQLHAIALGHFENQLGLQRALDVDVQLGLGHGLEQSIQPIRRYRVNFEHVISP